MQKIYLLIFIVISVNCSINGQDITVNDGDNCFFGDALNFSSSDGGSPPRNIYTGTDANGFPIRVILLSGSWRLQFDEGLGWIDVYTSTFASAPNPPHHSVGGWAETPFNCGGAGEFEFFGPGTQSVLPVELISFEIRSKKFQVELKWQTASELNNEKFEIEESRDGLDFHKIGEVNGNGTTLEQQEYSFDVENPRNGISYYRLKQIDFDGQFEYSKVISVNFKGEDGDVGEFYPNPSKSGLVNLDYNSKDDEKIEVSVLDVTGKLVINQIQQVSNGDNNLSFDFSELNKGIYIVKIGNERNPTHQKIIIER